MVKCQLCQRNEYGETSIIETGDLEGMIDKGKNLAHSDNIDNALTAEEKRRNWTSYFVELEGDSGEYLYAGIDGHGDHTGYEIKSDDNFDLLLMKNFAGKVKIYLGVLDREEWYATNAHKKPIDKIDSYDLNDKDFYFIRKI